MTTSHGSCLYGILVLYCVCLGCNYGQSQQEAFVPSAFVDTVKDVTRKLPSQTQLSIAIINNGKVVHVGVKNEDGKVFEVSNHQKVFEIGSITKLFTATILARMILNQQLKGSDSIDAYLDISIMNDAKISFVQLANHSSGLPRLPTNLDIYKTPRNPYANYNKAKLESYISKELIQDKSQIGKYLYSNVGPAILGYVLCQIGKSTYEELLKKYIFEPLRMKVSTTDRNKVKHLLVKGRKVDGSVAENWDLEAIVSAGGVLSSTEDLANFALAHFDTSNEDLALTRKRTNTVNHISDVGLGWEIINRKSGETWCRHSGGTGGYRSTMILDVNNKNGVVILSNISASSGHTNSIYDLSFDLMKSLLN